MKLAILKTLGHGRRRAEIDHVQRADADHLRDSRGTAASSRFAPAESIPPTSSSASSVVVRSSTPTTCRRAPVPPSIDHRRPSHETPRPPALGLQPLRAASTQGVVTPNIVAAIERSIFLQRRAERVGANHARQGMRGVRQGDARQPIQPGQIRHRRHHEQIAAADERPRLTTRQRAQHHLGHAEGQRPHRRGPDHRSRRPAEGQYALNLASFKPLQDDRGGSPRGGGNRLTAIPARLNGFERRSGSPKTSSRLTSGTEARRRRANRRPAPLSRRLRRELSRTNATS